MTETTAPDQARGWVCEDVATLLAEINRLTEERERSGEFVRQLDLDRKRFAQQVADADIEVRKVKTVASRERTTLLAERNAARFQAVQWRIRAANADPHCDPDSYMRAHPFDWEPLP